MAAPWLGGTWPSQGAEVAAAARAFAAAAALSDGMGVEALGLSPLWPDEMPDWAAEAWQSLRSHLLTDATDEGWEVWIDWYEARLKGAPGEDNLDGVPVNMELEKARVLIPEEVWEQGPKVVNTEIRRLIEEHTPKASDLPAERPTPVRFEFRDNALRPLPAEPAVAAEGLDAGARAAWQAIRELIDDQVAAGGGRQSPRLGRVLERCGDALGASFDALDLVRFGVHAARLQEFALRADEILMPEDASELVALNAQIGLFLGQFPEWSAYLRGVEDGFGSDRAEQAAVSDLAKALDGIREAAPEQISPEADAALAALEDEATPELTPETDAPVAPPLARRSYLRAGRSALRALFGKALEDVRIGVSKGVQKSAEATTVAALAAAKGYLIALASGLPGEFGWLMGLVTYIARMHGKSETRPGGSTPPDNDDGPVGV